MTNHRAVASSRGSGRGRVGILATLALGLMACDFDVTNPGPVQDEFLNDEGAFEAVVNGMGRGLADAMNYAAFHGGAVARELHPTGGTGSFGLNVPLYNGRLDPDDEGVTWNNSNQARWVSDDGIRRLQESMDAGTFSSSELVAQAYLWSGYAHRLLGENMCQAVFDGGPAMDKNEYLTRAEDRFSNAIQVGQSAGAGAIVETARAGRASVRAFLGDWSGAASDASSVSDGLLYQVDYFDGFGSDQYNRIHWATRNEPYKTATVWGTPYEVWFEETGDPRIPWEDSGQNGDGGVDCCGPVPFLVQKKYPDKGSNITLSSGAEMRLIEAEALLAGSSDIAGAMQIINGVRASVGVDPYPDPGSLAEAWAFLKRERGTQLWMEARRLGDFFRWNRDGTPGDRHPREVPGAESHMQTQDLCFPITDSERDTNPNIS